ncbi:hypothetical protein K438DRAFT_2032154 [Mycena galopus ATCC 62051]|nr:hypothetical protein K438DRAFT_2032154 [Mycena galopus ATCC 62051]
MERPQATTSRKQARRPNTRAKGPRTRLLVLRRPDVATAALFVGHPDALDSNAWVDEDGFRVLRASIEWQVQDNHGYDDESNSNAHGTKRHNIELVALGRISSSSTSQPLKTGSWSPSATCLRSSRLHSSPLLQEELLTALLAGPEVPLHTALLIVPAGLAILHVPVLVDADADEDEEEDAPNDSGIAIALDPHSSWSAPSSPAALDVPAPRASPPNFPSTSSAVAPSISASTSATAPWRRARAQTRAAAPPCPSRPPSRPPRRARKLRTDAAACFVRCWGAGGGDLYADADAKVDGGVAPHEPERHSAARADELRAD